MIARWQPDAIEIGRRIMANPDCDVQALADWVVIETAHREIPSPLAMLDAAIETANQNGTYRRQVGAPLRKPAPPPPPAIVWGKRGDPDVAKAALDNIFAMLDAGQGPDKNVPPQEVARC